MTTENSKQRQSALLIIFQLMLKKEILYFKDRRKKLTEESLSSWIYWFRVTLFHAIGRVWMLVVLRV